MVYMNNPYSYNYGYYPSVQTQYAQPMIYPQQQVVEQPQNLNVQSGQTTNAMDVIITVLLMEDLVVIQGLLIRMKC